MVETCALSEAQINYRLAIIRSDPEMACIARELDAISARLGTSDERADDTLLAQALGHRIRNLLCGHELRRSLEMIRVGAA